jgi:polysaccharide deacetylase family protein (PEP-CTERM system associated)
MAAPEEIENSKTSGAAEAARAPILNALSFDVEDYFHVANFASLVPFSSWDSHPSRVERSTEAILDLLSGRQARATFFVLGWVAERFPGLVRRIAAAGHEVGTHSHQHRLVYKLSKEAFREDLRRSIAVIEDAAGVKVLGHRAPSFSITRESLWALDVLAEEGLRYDSSVFPVRHHRYGIPDAPRSPYEPVPGLIEFPMSTVRIAGANLPIGGGGYFRLYPYRWTRWGLARLNRRGLPAMVYLHPWEFDPDQPRLQAPALARFRHYVNLAKTAERLERLLGEFRFASASDVLGISNGRGAAAAKGDPSKARLHAR